MSLCGTATPTYTNYILADWIVLVNANNNVMTHKEKQESVFHLFWKNYFNSN